MSSRTIRLSSGLVTIKTGSEGPHWDPYSYTETSFTRNSDGRVVTLHSGLAEWIKVNGKWVPKCLMRKHTPDALFLKLVGFHPYDLEKWERKLKSRCRKCGCRIFQSQTGYPGESWDECSKCGEVINSYFDESAII